MPTTVRILRYRAEMTAQGELFNTYDVAAAFDDGKVRVLQDLGIPVDREPVLNDLIRHIHLFREPRQLVLPVAFIY